MASDMVPNHMGIDSDWVINHPDWFVGLPYSPSLPIATAESICATMRALASTSRITISSARTLPSPFRGRDHWTGDVLTSTTATTEHRCPWNDTAQLDYLNPEVREAVDPDDPERRAALADHPFRCGDDVDQEALPAALVP